MISSLSAGPFGMEMGWSIEDLKRNEVQVQLKEKNYNISYYDVIPTLKHPDFDRYMVSIDDLKGIFKISVFGKTIEVSRYGTDLKSAYNKIKKQISSTYDSPEEYDFLFPGSIWDEPRDWMMSLLKGERALASFWSLPKNKDNISMIMLDANALSTDRGYIYLSYESYDSEEIVERNKSQLSNVF